MVDAAWLTAFVFVFAIALFLAFLWIQARSTRIDPKNLPTITTEYGVKAGESFTPLTKCGTGGNEPCTFTSNNLREALQRCDAFINCDAVSYNANSRLAHFVDPSSPSNRDLQVNTYVRQVPLIPGTLVPVVPP